MEEPLDWRHGAQHMWERHQVSPTEANEAIADPSRVVIHPDYNSKSGRTTRVIGYSEAAGALLSVILIVSDGHRYGVNGWRSNSRDRTIYKEANEK